MPDDTAPKPDSATSTAVFLTWLGAGVVLLNLFVIGMEASSLDQSRAQLEQSTAVAAGSLSRMLAESVASDIDTINLALVTTADEIQRQMAGGGIDAATLNFFLARQQKRVPEIFSLRVLDADGRLAYGDGAAAHPRLNNSDHEYFLRQRDNPHAGLVIAQTLFTRIDKKWAIPLSRPLLRPDGSFAGVVYANFALDHLTDVFSTVDVGQSGTIVLLDAEYRVLARYPLPREPAQELGKRTDLALLRELMAVADRTAAYAPSRTIDGVERKFAVCRIPDHPLHVVVSRATDDYMAPWRDQAANTLALTALFSLFTLLSSWLLYVTWQRRNRAEDEIHRLNAELEQRVAQRTLQLAAANRELEDFSYSMSHDMRTPLRAIDGFARILQDEHSARLDAEGMRLLKVVRENAQRMGCQIDDILHFLRLGKCKMECVEIDIAELAREVFATLQADSPSPQLRLDIRPLPPAWGDHDMVRQVLVNLLSNAIKFSPKDAAAVIEIDGAVTEEGHVYAVKDHGVGFDMQYVDKLFKVFERVHPTGLYQGTGVGLAMVKRIVERHGGRAWAEGRVGAGATLYFSLPNRRSAARSEGS